MRLKIKQVVGGGETFAVDVEGGHATVADLKAAVLQALVERGETAPGVRLIYKGQVLKDLQTVESYGEVSR